MFINPKWRILTIGDGDLSFSSALINKYQPQDITSTVFDDKDVLRNKYGDHFYQQIERSGHEVISSFDVLDPDSWSSLKHQQFDVVIFQFPLIPNFKDKRDYEAKCKGFSLNTLHRRLLRGYLIHCFKYFLDPQGVKLAYITSKDVKPYHQWNIENAISLDTGLYYLGAMKFDINAFPAYNIRNVDRDKFVPATNSFTYAFSDSPDPSIVKYVISPEKPDQIDLFCSICRAGPFVSSQDKVIHNETKKHQQMEFFENQWQLALKDTYFSFGD